MYGFYAIALFSITFIDAPVLNKIYFSGFLFLMFYSLTIIVSPFYIYTSLKYGNIVIYNQNKIITKNKTYNDVSIKVQKYCGRFSCEIYINFYSNNKLISRYFLEHLLYKSTELSEDLVYKLFNSNQNTNEIKKYLEKILNDIKKEKSENKNLLFKGLGINLIIFIIILLFISIFIFKHYTPEKNQTNIGTFSIDTPPKIIYFDEKVQQDIGVNK